MLRDHRRLLVVAPGGAGKTTWLRYVALSTATQLLSGGKLHTNGVAVRLPILVSLQAWREDMTLFELIAAQASALGLTDAETVLQDCTAHGECLLLFDDWESLGISSLSLAAEQMANLASVHPDNTLVIATRSAATGRFFPNFAAAELIGTTPSSAIELLSGWTRLDTAHASGLLGLLSCSRIVRELARRPGWLAAMSDAAQETRVTETDLAMAVVAQLLRTESRADLRPWIELASRLYHQRQWRVPVDDLPRYDGRLELVEVIDEQTARFAHAYLHAALAAQAVPDPLRLVDLADEWWAPVILLSAGHTPEVATLIRALVARGQPLLAAACLIAAPERTSTLEVEVAGALIRDIERGAPASSEVAGVLAALLSCPAGTTTSDVLVHALDHPRASIRREASSALGRLLDPRAIAPLITAMGDRSARVRSAAALALAGYGERTIQPLVRQLGVSSRPVREAAVAALAHQGALAVRALIPLLSHPTSMVRDQAASALAAIGDPAIPHLVEYLGDWTAERNLTARRAAASALVQIGRPAVRALLPALEQPGQFLHGEVMRILSDMADDGPLALCDVLAAGDSPDSALAASALGELEPTTASLTALVRALDDARVEVRWEARRSLRRIGTTARPALLQTLGGESPELRWEAVQLLMALPDPPMHELAAALKSLLEQADASDRRRVVHALAGLSGPVALDALLLALHDEDGVVRRLAASALGGWPEQRCIDTLLSAWDSETDPDTQEAILETLARVSMQAAMPCLVAALDRSRYSESVGRAASELLVTADDRAVSPLVQAWSRRPGRVDDGLMMFVLNAVGGREARMSSRPAARLARLYRRFLTETPPLEELVYLTTTVEGWPYRSELYRTFSTVQRFLGYQSLGGIAGAEDALAWIDEIDDWLSPGALVALRQLRSISQAVQYYHRHGNRRAKEQALLAASNGIAKLRNLVAELGEPHKRVFHAVAESWNDILNDAIREWQGEARLDVEGRTEQVRVQDPDAEAEVVLAFEVINRGEGLASNLTLTLLPDGRPGPAVALTAVTPTHYLPALGQGESVLAEYTVRRRGAGRASIALELRYDDPQAEAQLKHFELSVNFVVEETSYREIGRNPYIAGPPVKTQEMFHGRQDILDWITENLSGAYQDNVLVLYGERRTGKTSVLYQLQHHLSDEYAFVLIDLQSIAYSLTSTSDLLYAMARKASAGLRSADIEVARPERDEYLEHPVEQFELMGEAIGTQAAQHGLRVVLLCDEFDLLIQAVEASNVSPYVFDCIRGLMQHQDSLSFIFAGAQQLSAMLKNPNSILFNTALRRKVSFLNSEEAERLIREPVADVLSYDDLAVEKILRVTAGQPYFIQYICHELVNVASGDRRNFITLRDVDRALNTTVLETTGTIRHSYMSLTPDERLALVALARITDDSRPFVSLDDISETLQQHEVQFEPDALYEALQQLQERDFVMLRGGPSEGAARQFGFRMDLVRMWIEQNDEFRRLREGRRS
jgi:HEAT repeat protein